jgi:trk system potassium uptake protein TrkH
MRQRWRRTKGRHKCRRLHEGPAGAIFPTRTPSRVSGRFAIVPAVKKENPGKKKHRRAAEVSAKTGRGDAENPLAVVPIGDAPASLQPPAAPPEWLGPGLLIPLFTLVVVIGYLLFARNPGDSMTVPGNQYKIEQALFTSVNAASLTGFQQARNPGEYQPLGKVVILLLMLAGIEFSFLASGLAVVRIVRMRFTDYSVLLWSVAVTAAVALIGSVALLSKDRTWFDSLFLAVSAFGNCGLTTRDLPGTADMQSHLVLIPLALLGGLGLPVLMEIGTVARAVVNRLRHLQDEPGEPTRLSAYSRLVLRWTAGAYIVCFLVLLPLRWCGTHAVSWQGALAGSSIQAVNARSAGFNIEPVNDFPQVLTAVMVVVMLVGAAPAGTSGGIKLTSLAAVSRGLRDAVAGRPVRRIAGVAAVWMLIYLVLVGVITVTLLITEPEYQLDRTLFMAASAVGNVGLLQTPVEASPAGLYTLSFAMIAGRILPVLVLWWTVEQIPEAGIAVA